MGIRIKKNTDYQALLATSGLSFSLIALKDLILRPNPVLKEDVLREGITVLQEFLTKSKDVAGTSQLHYKFRLM
ncbi:hypothetical protein [Candidatus Nitrosotenuis sp. DW1]|uniref:hypothetical protein n=1 Tax=Candidatus Nitrosotenuis sp. DW1 TaxID=2259672 RepID=UPI0015C98887|nr:hypothetical protein [Candidatus Nitrosotenuis sp. DW1]QLH08593.1 hypothetical protein DSQ19_03055 [Candidatus Nitrosotenuis sp. DW1]